MHKTRTTLSKILVLSESDVQKCLPISSAIDINRKALGLLRSRTDKDDPNDGQERKIGAYVPTRIGLPYYRRHYQRDAKDAGAADWTLFKPAAYYPTMAPITTTDNDEKNNDNDDDDNDDDTIMGMKLVSTRSNNPSINKPLVPANIMLINSSTGEVNALLGGTYLTALRTAAGSAVATQLCKQQQQQQQRQRKNENGSPSHLVIFGAGLQAHYHLKTIQAVRDVDELTIVNRTVKRAEEWKDSILLGEEDNDDDDEHQKRPIDRVNVVSLSDSHNVQLAVGNADVICTTTNSTTPLFHGDWVKPNCHVNCIGSYTPYMKEVDEALVNRCEVFLDTEEAIHVGDLKHLLEDRRRREDDFFCGNVSGLLGDLIAGDISVGKRSGDEGISSLDCTMFKSVGTAIQDVMTAHEAVKRAGLLGIGQEIDL